ncbi:hypothetical protein F5141DRAFT_1127311 [Pisolithus sp. B1]|nr:hypothetical protein F5141DRAFT_1127311 [Pisolithus sp. B1]
MLEADKEVYAHTKSKLVVFGVKGSRSVQILRADILRGQGCCVGKGDTIWPNAHLDDT